MKAVVFDAYGTLFDVQSVAAACDRLFPGQGHIVSRLWRQKQLEYTWLRSLMDRYADFSRVTQDALEHTCAALALTLDAQGGQALMEAYGHLTLYPDTREALGALADHRLAILSNGAPAALASLVRHAGLSGWFEAVLSADAVRIFKPDPRVYALAVERLGLPAGDVAFVSSNFWDIAGATRFGFRTFWINRSALPPDNLGETPAAVLSSLGELAGQLP